MKCEHRLPFAAFPGACNSLSPIWDGRKSEGNDGYLMQRLP